MNEELLDTVSTIVDSSKAMKNLTYPLKFSFKIGTLANDFVIKDASGATVVYVRQKMFKFIDEIQVFNNESKSQVLYTIKANKWIDFSASYLFSDSSGNKSGRIARKGMASIWKARYEIYDKNDEYQFIIGEDNGWTKVFDAMLGEVPVLGMFTGYMFNPSYTMKREDGTEAFRLKKDKSFFGRHFSLNTLSQVSPEEEQNAILSFMMMILMERRRG